MAANTDEEPGANEWTHIVRKGKRSKNNNKNKNNNKHSSRPLAAAADPPAAGPAENFHPNPAPKLSLADIQAEHARLRAKWRATASHARLRDLVTAKAGSSHAGVARAVCLGLGAFEPEDGSWVAGRRSHVQLAAFLGMVEALEQAVGGKIECFYQEPRFSQTDKDFIAALGGIVVESPGSYALVDDKTVVFGVHLYRDIWAAALKKSLPAIFVGTGWDVWDNTGAGESVDFNRIREMNEADDFDTFQFPQDDDDPGAFSSTCIYWRRILEEAQDGTDELEKAVASLDLEPDKVVQKAGDKAA